MSNHHHHFHGPRQIVPEKQDINRELNVLQSAINLTGRGEDPAVRALLTKLVTATDSEALDIALQLQRIIRGPASMLENLDDPSVQKEMNRLKAERAKLDETRKAYEADRVKFIEESLNNAEKRYTKAEWEQIRAKGLEEYRDALAMERADMESAKLQFHQDLKTMPEIEIDVEPIYETYMVNGAQSVRVLPQVITILDRRWVLPAGKQKVPQIVAEWYEEIKRNRAENRERAEAMSADAGRSAQQIEVLNQKINRKYKTTRESVAVPS